MKHHLNYSRWIIWLSLLISLIMQCMPWPEGIYMLQPSWFLLVFIYWILTFPHLVSIGTGFWMGEIVDLIMGSTLGVHALALSILTYLIVINFHFFRNLALLQQIFMIIVFSMFMDFIILFEEIIILHNSFASEIFYNSIINGMFWPLIYPLMKKIQDYFAMH